MSVQTPPGDPLRAEERYRVVGLSGCEHCSEIVFSPVKHHASNAVLPNEGVTVNTIPPKDRPPRRPPPVLRVVHDWRPVRSMAAAGTAWSPSTTLAAAEYVRSVAA